MWNAFKFCTALRALGSIMILLVLGIVGLSYYALVVASYGPAILVGGFDTVIALAVMLLFHTLLVMLLWSYFSVVVADPGGVPSNWRPMLDQEKGDMDPLVGVEHNGPGLELDQSTMPSDPSDQRMRFCRKCNHFKPPRCHHCSICGRCVLKMDHHCVWVVNCVGALNYKCFLLFLFYTFLETTLVTLSLLPYFVALFTDGEVTGTPSSLAAIFITFILNLTFAMSVMGFLIMHISLVASNTTTIEAYEKRPSSKWHFDIGRTRNFEQVFGMEKKYWLIPAYSDEDLKRMPALHGLEYPTKSDFSIHPALNKL